MADTPTLPEDQKIFSMQDLRKKGFSQYKVSRLVGEGKLVNIRLIENFIEGNAEYKGLLRLASKNREVVESELSPKQLDLLEKYNLSVNEMNAVSETAAFEYVFSLGVRLMTESVSIQQKIKCKAGLRLRFFLANSQNCTKKVLIICWPCDILLSSISLHYL